ncbi:hypothetical protein [Nitrospira sp. Kam-Ns4a]
MGRGTSGLLVGLGLLWGCATSGGPDQIVQDALQEREEAYARLARAMSAYCTARYALPEAKQECLIEKQGELAALRRVHERGPVPDRPPAIGLAQGDGALAPSSVKCERVRRETVCSQMSLAYETTRTP